MIGLVGQPGLLARLAKKDCLSGRSCLEAAIFIQVNDSQVFGRERMSEESCLGGTCQARRTRKISVQKISAIVFLIGL